MLSGCNGLNRLLDGPTTSRNSVGEPSGPDKPEQRIEPYGVFTGTYKTGEKLYLIHWIGNPINNTGMLESLVDNLSIPKYNN